MMRRLLTNLLTGALTCAAVSVWAADTIDIAGFEKSLDISDVWLVAPADPEPAGMPDAGVRFVDSIDQLGNLASGHAIWLKAEFTNSRDQDVSRLLELSNPLLARVTMYIAEQNKPVRIEHSGFRTAVAEKSLHQPNPVMPLRITAGGSASVYLHVFTLDRMWVPSSMWTTSAFYQKQQINTFIAALGIGVIMVMAFFNIGIWRITRDITYRDLAAACGSLSSLLLISQGWAATYIWPDMSVLTTHTIGPVLAVTMTALLGFCQRFLTIPADSLSGRIISATHLANLIVGLGLLLLPGGHLATLMMMYNIPALLIPIVHAWRLRSRNHSEGAQFLLAVAPTVVACVFALSNRVLELKIEPAISQNISIIGAALLSINLGLLLAARIRRINAERDAAYKEMLQARHDAQASATIAQEATRDNQAKSAFLATMSHEIRTPDERHPGHGRSAAAHPARPAAVLLPGHAGSIRSGADGLSSTMCSTTRRSKPASSTLERIDTNLIQLLDDLIVLLREPVTRKGLECHLYLHPEVPRWIRTDPTRLKQVLNNLISNAVKFTDEGEVSIRVKQPEPGRLSFVIRR